MRSAGESTLVVGVSSGWVGLVWPSMSFYSFYRADGKKADTGEEGQ